MSKSISLRVIQPTQNNSGFESDCARRCYEHDLAVAIDEGISAAIAKGLVNGSFSGEWKLERATGIRVEIKRASFTEAKQKKGGS